MVAAPDGDHVAVRDAKRIIPAPRIHALKSVAVRMRKTEIINLLETDFPRSSVLDMTPL
jgi:hypothetical protein